MFEICKLGSLVLISAIECWNILKYEIESIIDQFIPLKKKQGKRSIEETLVKRSY